jgi:Ser/Thr protein kinase RdoA (MazF antagonist)
MTQLEQIARQFNYPGRLLGVERFPGGHIHETYVAAFEEGGAMRRLLLQRLNLRIFPDPDALQDNIERVTRHLAGKIRAAGGDPQRETLTVIRAREGGLLVRDGAGDCWRAFLFIEGALAYEQATSLEHVAKGAAAFARFQCRLADFPAETLHEILPGFHDTPRRYARFQEIVARDPVGRAAGVRAEIRFLEQREPDTRVLMDRLRSGELPLRVSHYDTKYSNVLMDDATGEALCVIDLDTVMPGLAGFDFGDAVRAGAALVREDEPDAQLAGISLDIYQALARGYLSVAAGFLTPLEIETLPFAARLITLEQAIRFLGDYIDGDTYYRVSRPGHNLDRARTQIRMLEDMEEKYETMLAITSNCLARHGQATGEGESCHER